MNEIIGLIGYIISTVVITFLVIFFIASLFTGQWLFALLFASLTVAWFWIGVAAFTKMLEG